MNARQTNEINLWTCTKEEEDEWNRQQEQIRKKITASLKFQYGDRRSKTLIEILFSTPLPDPAASRKDIKRLRTPELIETLSPHNLPESPRYFNWLMKEEKWHQTNRSLQWLRLQVYSYHIGKRKKDPRPDCPHARNWHQCIETLNDFKTAFHVGSALALYEQMDRADRNEPSLSKAHWILERAPDVGGRPRPNFGSPGDIAHAWKHYYHFSHYWAAYVAMTGEPFSFDPATLVKFACKANFGRFRRLAATYLEFRRGVVTPRSKQKGYISQGLDEYNNVRDIANVRPIARELLPNLLNAEQWRTLDDYSAPLRKNRA